MAAHNTCGKLQKLKPQYSMLFMNKVCLWLCLKIKIESNYSPRSPKSHIWRILNENDSEKCSHSPLCCAFSESFSFNLHSNLTFHQDFKIVVNRYLNS